MKKNAILERLGQLLTHINRPTQLPHTAQNLDYKYQVIAESKILGERYFYTLIGR